MVRRSGGSAAHAPLDLEDLLLLRAAHALALADVAVGGLLELVEELVPLVRPELPVLLGLLEVVRGVTSEVADLDPRLLHPLVDLAHEVVPPLLGQGRDVEPHDMAVDVR